MKINKLPFYPFFIYSAQEIEGAAAIDVTGDGEGVEMSQDDASSNEIRSMMVAADLHALDESL